MIEILELTDRIISDCQKLQNLVRTEFVKEMPRKSANPDSAVSMSDFFWDCLTELKIDRKDKKILPIIQDVLGKMGFQDDQGRGSTKKFTSRDQVQQALTAIVENIKIEQTKWEA
jgi:hypothetical protein